MSLTIGISKGSGSPKYRNYWRWLEESGADIAIVDLATSEDVAADMNRIDGLLLTGGSDIEPSRYGHPELEPRCEDIDRVRDAREFQMLDIATERELPVLGICRGMQVLNVHRGGTLIAHLPDRVEGSQSHQKDGDADRRHEVEVDAGTLLFKASGLLSGNVNSAHHQAVDRLGEGLTVAARSTDGVVEAIELGNKVGAPYLLAIQWHPERMEDPDSGFSSGIREQFLFEASSARILSGVRKPAPKPDPEPPTIDSTGPESPNPMFPIIG